LIRRPDSSPPEQENRLAEPAGAEDRGGHDAAEGRDGGDQRAHGGADLLVGGGDERRAPHARALLTCLKERAERVEVAGLVLGGVGRDHDGAVAVELGEVEVAGGEAGEPLAHRVAADAVLLGGGADAHSLEHLRGRAEDNLRAVDLAGQGVGRQDALVASARCAPGERDGEDPELCWRRELALTRALREVQLDATAGGTPAAGQERVPLARVGGSARPCDEAVVGVRICGEYVHHHE
jgi:hypothetical protein